nr:probable 28S rRNA (cytosine-C(5))-methyltransferase [Vanessa tameamea]
MFEHSVKVPRHYKVAANIFKKAYTEGGSVKTLLYDEKLRHFRTNVLYALITETIKHAVDIEKIFETCEILTKEPRLDPWLAKVLAAELLYGKKALPGKSKPELTILSYKEQLEKIIPEQQDDLKSKVVRRPRYVRINTNLLATSDAIRAFQDEGYKFIRCTSGTYDDYLQQIQSLTEYDFTQDYHIKTMFVFAPGTKLHEHDLYLENQIILQDKATALAVHLLAPPTGSTVLDMCAAPGMKTTQLAAYLRNQGKIYAVERNEDRYKTLCDFVERTGSKCVETLHKDSLEIRRGDCDDVEYILLDPSCSGSGMDLHVHNYIEDTRLARLTSLQEKFLKHAMNSFPNAKRIVYSTCSLFPEENERVITNVVKTSRAKWRVQDVKELLKGQWNNFGSGMYGSMGTRCLYAVPNSDFTTGFFLAVLDRDPKDMEKSQESAVEAKNHNKMKNEDTDIKVTEETDMLSEVETEEKDNNKKKKKKKIKVENTDGLISNIEEEADMQNEDEPKGIEKRMKKKKDVLEMSNDDNVGNTEIMSAVNEEYNDVETKKKKKINEEASTSEQQVVKHEYIEMKDSDSLNDSNEITKKKKKRKSNTESTIDIIENQENSVYTNEPENINETTETKKKKKRKTNEEFSADITNEERWTKKASKKYNIEIHKDDVNETTITDNNEEPVKTKKKKKKDKTHHLTENFDEFNGNSDNKLNEDKNVDNSNKKRKNKSKHFESSETIDVSAEDVAPKKKKKRKEL